MLVFARVTVDRRDLGFGNVTGINAANALPGLVNTEHDARRIFPIVTKDRFEYVHHELHRRVVIIQEQHFVERRTLGLRARLHRHADIIVVVVICGHLQRVLDHVAQCIQVYA